MQTDENVSIIKQSLTDYLSIVESTDTEIDNSIGLNLFEKYISVIGAEYKKIGFIEVTPNKFIYFNSLIVDFILFVAFFRFPYPITTLFLIGYYYFFKKPYYDSKKVYGLYY
jgi:hypothetical protein